MKQKITYAKAGVDRKLRAESKKVLQELRKTFRFSHYGRIINLPYGKIFPCEDCYMDLVIEGVGTKVLVAQLANKFDTIGVDGVAMAVNDVIRSGATPLALSDNIHLQRSDPELISELMKGIVRGAKEAECVVPSGEIGDVTELIKGLTDGFGFDMVFASIGTVTKEKVISGTKIKPDDRVLGLRSSGLHSNGISLARKVLFKQWGGKYDPHDVPEGLTRRVVEEVLEPTKIYVKSLLSVSEEIEIKGAVHITGDAYLKFGRLTEFSKGIGFEFDNFDPHPIFDVIQNASADLGERIRNEEMFKTFNMGWGFALIIDKKDSEDASNILEKAGATTQEIGRITRSGGIKVLYRNQKIRLK